MNTETLLKTDHSYPTVFQKLVSDPHITVMDHPKNIISIFDDLHYDRSDVDIISPAMRRYLLKKLKLLNFKQKTGNTFECLNKNIRCVIPKIHALGTSPFDVTLYTHKRTQDFYILTPTQTACLITMCCPIEEAVKTISNLIKSQPININRMQDYLEQSTNDEEFLTAIPHLRYVQGIAVKSEPLSNMRALK